MNVETRWPFANSIPELNGQRWHLRCSKWKILWSNFDSFSDTSFIVLSMEAESHSPQPTSKMGTSLFRSWGHLSFLSDSSGVTPSWILHCSPAVLWRDLFFFISKCSWARIGIYILFTSYCHFLILLHPPWNHSALNLLASDCTTYYLFLHSSLVPLVTVLNSWKNIVSGSLSVSRIH